MEGELLDRVGSLVTPQKLSQAARRRGRLTYPERAIEPNGPLSRDGQNVTGGEMSGQPSASAVCRLTFGRHFSTANTKVVCVCLERP